MNIYFACSITGGREFEPVYQAIIAALLADGHTIPTAHLADSDVIALEAIVTVRGLRPGHRMDQRMRCSGGRGQHSFSRCRL